MLKQGAHLEYIYERKKKKILQLIVYNLVQTVPEGRSIALRLTKWSRLHDGFSPYFLRGDRVLALVASGC